MPRHERQSKRRKAHPSHRQALWGQAKDAPSQPRAADHEEDEYTEMYRALTAALNYWSLGAIAPGSD